MKKLGGLILGLVLKSCSIPPFFKLLWIIFLILVVNSLGLTSKLMVCILLPKLIELLSMING
ncbi:hypothetical protein ACSBR1_036107 [Camellia fascicularis]